jgi:cytochrome bd-type quinol oxidase subunit 1
MQSSSLISGFQGQSGKARMHEIYAFYQSTRFLSTLVHLVIQSVAVTDLLAMQICSSWPLLSGRKNMCQLSIIESSSAPFLTGCYIIIFHLLLQLYIRFHLVRSNFRQGDESVILIRYISTELTFDYEETKVRK